MQQLRKSTDASVSIFQRTQAKLQELPPKMGQLHQEGKHAFIVNLPMTQEKGLDSCSLGQGTSIPTPTPILLAFTYAIANL